MTREERFAECDRKLEELAGRHGGKLYWNVRSRLKKDGDSGGARFIFYCNNALLTAGKVFGLDPMIPAGSFVSVATKHDELTDEEFSDALVALYETAAKSVIDRMMPKPAERT